MFFFFLSICFCKHFGRYIYSCRDGRAPQLISKRPVPCRSFPSRPARFTFQVAFWDALKTLDDGAARRAGSLARLMAHLVIRKQLSLTVLKVIRQHVSKHNFAPSVSFHRSKIVPSRICSCCICSFNTRSVRWVDRHSPPGPRPSPLR